MYLKIQLHIGSTKVCHLEEQCFGKIFHESHVEGHLLGSNVGVTLKSSLKGFVCLMVGVCGLEMLGRKKTEIKKEIYRDRE